MFRLAVISCVLCLNAAGQQQTSSKIDFPKIDEIQLVVRQAERAFEQYKQSVELESHLAMEKQQKAGVNRDRELIDMAEKIISGLKSRPDAFHGLGGLLLLSNLDDASRNAALCSNEGVSEIASGLIDRPNATKAYELLHVSQTCTDVSVQLYTVSESVHALLVRELQSQQLLNQQAMETINRCKTIIQQQTANKSPASAPSKK